MKTEDINDPLFRSAVESIDSGDLHSLSKIVNNNPYLIKEKLINTEKGYFQDPFLLYFIADNPIRSEKLADNIVDITRWIVNEIKLQSPENWQQQINYTLALVVTGRIPRECGVQIELTDLLIDTGATPAEPLGAIAHGNKEVAAHLVKRGATLNLATAVGLQLPEEEISKLAEYASSQEKLVALTTAAFHGDANMLSFLIDKKFPVNGYPENNKGFHSHATPLHQAVYSGSIDAVKLLIKAGADTEPRDKVYGGTPLGWAEYMLTEEEAPGKKDDYAEIANYLKFKI
ncbi:MAG: ankyrin repeat domain-containing protein [Chitinophagaceae bacterium]